MSVFDGFFSFLNSVSGADDSAPMDDLKISAASLLVHMMDADGLRLEEEVEELKALLAKHYDVEGPELTKLFEAGVARDQSSVDFYAATRVLRDNLDREARADFVEMMWQIVYADGERHEVEDHVLNRIAELMGIERPVQIAIRHKVEAQKGLR